MTALTILMNKLALGQKYAWIPTLCVSITALSYTVATYNEQRSANMPKVRLLNVELIDPYGKPSLTFGVLLDGRTPVNEEMDISAYDLDVRKSSLSAGPVLLPTFSIASPPFGRPRYFSKAIRKDDFRGSCVIEVEYKVLDKKFIESFIYSFPAYVIGGNVKDNGGGELIGDMVTGVKY